MNPGILDLMGVPAQQLSGTEVRELQRPSVYAWVRGDEVLYVGSSRLGLVRAILPTHHRLAAVEAGDMVLLWRFSSSDEAVQSEQQLIATLRPRLNNNMDSSFLPHQPVPAPKIRPGSYGGGLFFRGRSWFLDFQYKGKRHQINLGRQLTLSGARKLANLKRAELERQELLDNGLHALFGHDALRLIRRPG